MRKLPIAVQVSIAVHAITITGVLALPKSAPTKPEHAQLTDIEILPVEPVRPPAPPAPAPAVAPVAPIAPVAPPAHVARPQHVEVAAVAPAHGGREPSPPPSGPRSSLMMMRRPGELNGAPRVELPRARWDDLDHAPKGTAPEKDLSTGLLDPAGGGSYQSNQGVFTGKVNPDGTVTIKDAGNLQLGLPSAKQRTKEWAGSEDKRPVDPTALDSNVFRDDDKDTKPDSGQTVKAPVASFDVSDWLMRRNGEDPYASRKLAFLDSTRDERVQIGARYRTQQLGQSTQLMQKNLNALWAATQDPAQRKQALFELWDECAETGDPQLVAGAQAARKLVIGFIRARLPAGSAGAYTAEELARDNAKKQSEAAFAPYE